MLGRIDFRGRLFTDLDVGRPRGRSESTGGGSGDTADCEDEESEYEGGTPHTFQELSVEDENVFHQRVIHFDGIPDGNRTPAPGRDVTVAAEFKYIKHYSFTNSD
ncbi:hypothetical protein [Halegenticoccus tardaugens]|uniref:hypothetical protein n=1 Tax=Halegenticoccus tardaugens TaxID=2071624 RepID=UPI00100A699F|nr:hypothetical protein [Halegenticoccus tardaugens]